jgi:hypothetical protein
MPKKDIPEYSIDFLFSLAKLCSLKEVHFFSDFNISANNLI